MQWIDENRWQQNALPHKHNYFVIVWVKKGSGIHLIDLDKYQLTPGTIYCLSPGQIHLLKADEGTEGSVLTFTADFLCMAEDNYDLLYNSGLFYTLSQKPVIPVTEALRVDLEEVMQKMQKEYENFFLMRAEILRSFLKIFLIYLTRHTHLLKAEHHHSRNSEMVRLFFSSLEKNYTKKKKVADYADELVVTPNYLNEIVKKVSGSPASEHIKQRVALEAKRQAAYSDVSMKEIAYSLGFDDIAGFSKYFKNATGMNFSVFKKNTELLLNS
jgi:AraC-like DNA-binding protein